MEVFIREARRNGRGDNGDHFLASLQVTHEGIDVVDDFPGLVGTSVNAGRATDTRIRVESDMAVLVAIIAVPGRADADTGIAKVTFFFVDTNNRGEFFHGIDRKK